MNAEAADHDALIHNHNVIHVPQDDNINKIEMFMEGMMLDPPAQNNRLYWPYRLPDDQVEQLEDIGIPRHFLYRRINSPCPWVKDGVRCRHYQVHSNADWRRHLEAHVGKVLNIRFSCPFHQCQGRAFSRHDALARHLGSTHAHADH
ncbi:hypothetical protein SISSUDRAFT_1053257 [Sistotremastrum suecicum HHB10207 ss-3]|uniref:Uncharacterized protein n=1 Tax=Sistotremastrum suecicum HHB10207 ss-3 TaxID=1314776 RepID=A0A165ZBQ9_9AGAM|nr:hypothetical protein SISSUDRAFT_1053257 [Sistotremastrum suecicum HHB10207 ss-3]